MKSMEPWIRPSKRQMIAKCIEDLAGAHRIRTTRTDDDLLWCAVDMSESPDSVLATLGMMIMKWGAPLLMDRGHQETRYLFDPLHSRVRDSAN